MNIMLEAAGSVECARKIAELGKPCDLFASADYKVIDQLLIPDHASWNMPFAGNEMALVYQDASKYAGEITLANWLEILQRSDVLYGRSDPNADPCGYRAVMTLKLAEMYYNQRGVAEKILKKDCRFIRPKEVDLLALLESGTLDYIFLYRSVAIQHGLKYLALPREVNLSDISLDTLYRRVSVVVRGTPPESAITMHGEPMVYGLTIPRNAPNESMAIEFLKFFLAPSGGQAIIKLMGQTALVPSVVENSDDLPEALKEFSLTK